MKIQIVHANGITETVEVGGGKTYDPAPGDRVVLPAGFQIVGRGGSDGDDLILDDGKGHKLVLDDFFAPGKDGEAAAAIELDGQVLTPADLMGSGGWLGDVEIGGFPFGLEGLFGAGAPPVDGEVKVPSEDPPMPGDDFGGDLTAFLSLGPSPAPDIDLGTLDGSDGFSIPMPLVIPIGTAVAGAGDVNGDGFDDVLVGLPLYGVFMTNGAPSPGPAEKPVIGLDGTNGTFFPDPGGYGFGISVETAGDFNGDGFADFIGGGPVSFGGAGGGVVLYGSAGPLPVPDAPPTGGAHYIYGYSPTSLSGFSVSGGGDFNGDGFDDVVLGMPGAGINGPGQGYASYYLEPLGGGAAVIFGDDCGCGYSSMAGIYGYGAEIFGHQFTGAGWSVAMVGDMNGDGFDDIAMSSGTGLVAALGSFYSILYGSYSPGSGYGLNYIAPPSAHVLFGGADVYGYGSVHDLDGTNGFNVTALLPLNGFGYSEVLGLGGSVASAGDMNGDGFADLAVSAWGLKIGPVYSVIQSIYAGGPPTTPEEYAALFDTVIETVEDNLVSAGAVVFGHAGDFPETVDASVLNGFNGFQLTGMSFEGQKFLTSLSGIGDVNGDGFDDLGGVFLPATMSGDLQSLPNEGPTLHGFVIFGGAGGFSPFIDVSSLDGIDGFDFYLNEPVPQPYGLGPLIGIRNIDGAGDVNGDGFDDMIVSDPTTGTAYVVFGGDFRQEVALRGGEGGDTIHGTALSEILVGGLGDDFLSGGLGADVIQAGAGNDRIAFDGSDRHVDGGHGFDVLLCGTPILDLGAMANNRIVGIEKIDLTGGGPQTLSLSHLDLLDLAPLSNDLFVDGEAGDKVVVDPNQGTWTDLGVVGGYQVFDHANSDAVLHVLQGVDVSLPLF